jgi:hypothetical protein
MTSGEAPVIEPYQGSEHVLGQGILHKWVHCVVERGLSMNGDSLKLLKFLIYMASVLFLFSYRVSMSQYHCNQYDM